MGGWQWGVEERGSVGAQRDSSTPLRCAQNDMWGALRCGGNDVRGGGRVPLRE